MALWLKNAPVSPSLQGAMDKLDNLLTEAVAELKPVEEKTMSITGLQSGEFKAMLAAMKQEISDIQNQGLAEIKAAKEQAAADIKSKVSGATAKIKSEISDALQEFAQFTNE